MPKRHISQRSENAASDPLVNAANTLRDRQQDALRVYRPGSDAQERIHTSPATTLVVSGANRSGKTVCSFAEAASRILGISVFNRAGKKFPLRFPVPKKKENFEYWFIGHDLDHIGQTIYRILFQPGLFYVIWDPAQEQFVAWNENIKWHELNIEKRLPAGPLIPSDLIDENTWTWNPQGGGKGSNCFESVQMKNGAVIRAFPSSTPQAKQGDPVRGIVVDEDVKYGEHVPEYFARLADYGGWFMWPAWPHDENYMLSNLIDGCEKAEAEGDTRFEHIKLTLTENPFINNEKKRLQIARFSMLGDEEMVQSRIEGERHLESRRMYDFQPGLHGISSEFIVRAIPELDPQTPRGILQKIYRRDGQLPREWTRYAAIDPSTRRTAVLVGCVPPPVVEGVAMTPTVILEYEVVVKRFNPYQVAAAIQESADGRVFEAFIMDRHFGRQVHQSAGMATWDVFAKAFDDIKLYSRQTRNYFIPSCDIVADRCAWVRDCLRDVQNASSPQENLHPQLILILDKTPETQKEFLRYYRKKEVITGIERITELPENPRKFDCMQGLEYLIAYLHPMLASGVGYVEPETQTKSSSPVKDLAERIMGRVAKYIHLGPGQAA
jgi:hypothetical protein